MQTGSSKSGWLQAGFIRSSMFSKAVLPGDAELGKKDDDHRPGAAPRSPLWTLVKKPPRWRRRRILLAILGLCLLYVFTKNVPGLGFENGTRQPLDIYGGATLDPTLGNEDEYRAADNTEPTGAPPGSRAPRAGEPAPHTYGGPIRFFRLATSLHGASHTLGYRPTNRNVLFAMSSLKSASTVLPVICEMSRWSRNWVHATFMGRENIDIAQILEINGIDQTKCPAIWHDARPDYMEYSTDARAEAAVMSSMSHIHSFLHPQVAIMDDALAEDDFFVRGMRAKTKLLNMPLIEGPKNWDTFTWMTRLDAGSLRSWNTPTVEILIQVPPRSSSIIRLLKSIKSADYSGLKLPHLTIELPLEIDDSVRQYLDNFKWPQNGEQNLIAIRRRVTNQHVSQEDSAARFLELFYPNSAHNSYALMLSPQAELSAQYYQYIMYMLLEYRYSSYGAADSANVMGVSLELPSTLLDGSSKLNRPKPKDMQSPRYEELFSSTPSVPFLWQAPNSHATLFFGDKWVELHSFVSKRIAKNRQSPETTSRQKLVSETLPSWMEYILEYMRARGYALLYPGANSEESLVTIHNELYRSPEEFSVQIQKQTPAEAAGTPPKPPAEPFLAGEPPPRPKFAEPTIIPDSWPLHLALPFEGDLPEISHIPYMLYNGKMVSPLEVSITSSKFSEKYREVIGGCKVEKGRKRKIVKGSAADLFCFGDEDEGDWDYDSGDVYGTPYESVTGKGTLNGKAGGPLVPSPILAAKSADVTRQVESTPAPA